MECSLSLSLFLLYRWTMHVSLDETIVIYMVGCLYVELAMYDGTMHVGYLICLLWKLLSYISYVIELCLVKYIYICHIYFLWKLLDLIKNRKKTQYAGSLPSATDGNGPFAVCRGRQRSHVASSCASWELTHLVSLPTVADGKDFAVRGGRQRTCSLPTVADGKEPGI